MAEVGFTPEAFTIKPPERGPLDGVKRKVFEFVKSQTPSAHARRTMERYDWVGDQLDGKSRELFETMRPAVEKAAKVAGISTTAMEIIFATQVAAALAILGGKVGGDLLLNKEIRNKTVAGVKDVAEKAKNESKTIVEGAYKKVKQGVTAGLGAIGAGGALEWLKSLGKKSTTPAQEVRQPTTAVAGESTTAQSASSVDKNTRDETVLSSEFDTDISTIRKYAEAALDKSKQSAKIEGRWDIIKASDDEQILIREITDSTDSAKPPRIVMRFINNQAMTIITFDISHTGNRGFKDQFDFEGFTSATANVDQYGRIKPNSSGSRRRRDLDVKDMEHIRNLTGLGQ